MCGIPGEADFFTGSGYRNFIARKTNVSAENNRVASGSFYFCMTRIFIVHAMHIHSNQTIMGIRMYNKCRKV